MDDANPDLNKMIASARARAARAPAQIADGLTRMVHQAPDERLERLMKSPARRVILEGVFWQMPSRLDRRRAAGVNAAVLWRITGRKDGGADDFRVLISDGAAKVMRGPSDQPPLPVVTMTIGGVDFLKLITGGLDPMQGYFKGRIELAGDIMFAARLGGMFRVPAAPAAPAA
jgi:putative sterol carrier protein